MKRTNIHLPHELRERLQLIALERNISVAALVREALEEKSKITVRSLRVSASAIHAIQIHPSVQVKNVLYRDHGARERIHR